MMNTHKTIRPVKTVYEKSHRNIMCKNPGCRALIASQRIAVSENIHIKRRRLQ
jgi:hypothetical protein